MTLLLERTARSEHRPASFEERVGEVLWRMLLDGLQERTAEPATVVAGSDLEPALLGILDGSCRVFLRAAGNRQITLRYSRRGDVVGLLALFDSWPGWGVDAVRRTTYVRIPVERVRSLLLTSHPFTRAVAEEVATIAVDAVQMAVSTTSESMAARVAAHLLEAAEPTAGGRSVAHMTHQRLADSAGTAREVVTRMLRRFRDEGAVMTGPGTIEVVDRDRLLRVVRLVGGGLAPS